VNPEKNQYGEQDL